MSNTAIVPPSGTGQEAPDPLGRMRQVKASALATNEAYTLTETTLPPGLGAPRHVHAEHEEAFYVLHGQVSFQVSGERIEASVGDFVLVPRGVEHAFDITGGQPAQYLCIFSPPITDRERESLAQQVSAYKEQAT